jgi:hypothetical protein
MLMATLFLGGWDIPFWTRDHMLGFVDGVWVGTPSPRWWKTVVTFLAFALKTFFFIMVFMLVRWTVPRFRYDQVMDLGWKIMLPAVLVVVVVTAGTVLALDSPGAPFVRVAADGTRGYITLAGRAGADGGERAHALRRALADGPRPHPERARRDGREAHPRPRARPPARRGDARAPDHLPHGDEVTDGGDRQGDDARSASRRTCALR